MELRSRKCCRKNTGLKRAGLAVSLAMLCFLFRRTAFAAGNEGTKISEVRTEIPDVKVFLNKPLAEDSISGLQARMGSDNTQLSLVSSGTEKEDPDPETVYLLYDNSGSISAAESEKMKEAVRQVYGGKRDADQFYLISFGQEAGEPVQIDSAEKLESTLAALTNRDQNTALYAAIQKAAALSDAAEGTGRRVLYVFTDGVQDLKSLTDPKTPGYTEQDSLSLLGKSGLPLYLFQFPGDPKADPDAIGAFARASGGEQYIFTGESSKEQFESAWEDTNAGQFLLFDYGKQEVPIGEQTLTLQSGDGLNLSTAVQVSKWKKDTVPPEIRESSFTAPSAIRIVFSENVENADRISAYSVRTESGQAVSLAAADYDQADCTATLTAADHLAAGTYTVVMTGITDSSMEKNPLTGETSITVSPEQAVTETAETADTDAAKSQNLLLLVILICAGGFIAAFAVIVIARLRKVERQRFRMAGGNTADAGGQQKQPAPANAPAAAQSAPASAVQAPVYVPLPAAASSKPQLQLDVMSGQVRIYHGSIPMDRSAIFGRSRNSDYSFDDKELSKQHFALEFSSNEVMIRDLNSSNGTFVNDIRIAKPRKLAAGDIVRAGMLKFIFRW